MNHTIRCAIARDEIHKVWIVLNATKEDAEEAVRLEFEERYGVTTDDIESWPVISPAPTRIQ